MGHQHAARADARPRACSPARAARKQIIMVTDGEPTAHIEGGEPYFHYPPSPLHDRGDAARRCMRCTRTASASTRSCSTRATTCAQFVERMMQHEPRPGVLHDARHPRRLRARRLPRADGANSAAPARRSRALQPRAPAADESSRWGTEAQPDDVVTEEIRLCWFARARGATPRSAGPDDRPHICAVPGGSRSSWPTAMPRSGSR